MPEIIVFILVGGAFGGLIGSVMAHRFVLPRRARRMASKGQAELGVRVIDGAVPKQRPRWQYGRAVLDPGKLEFHSYIGSFHLLRRKPVTIEVTAADPATRRTPTGFEVLRFTSKCDILQLRTPTATIEVAVPRLYDWQWVLSRLAC